MRRIGIAALVATGCTLGHGAAAQTAAAGEISLPAESAESWKAGMPKPLASGAEMSGAGQAILGSLRFCGGIGDRDGRLSCYDDVATHNGIAVNQISTSAPVTQWIIKSNPEKADYLAALSSGVPIDDHGDRQDQPVVLYVRCRNGNPLVYFKSGHPTGRDAIPVELSQGDGTGSDSAAVGRYTLWPSGTGDAFGVWNREAATNMVNYLLAVNTLRLRYALPGAPGVSVRFDLSRTAKDTADVRRACQI